MKFNEKLMSLRRKAGLSQEELGEKLNVTRQTISKWELGQTTPEMEKLKEMSNLFQISVDELLSDKEITASEEPIKMNEPKKSKKGWIVAIIILAVILLLVFYLVPMFLTKNILNYTMKEGTPTIRETLEKVENIMKDASEKLEVTNNMLEGSNNINQKASEILEQAQKQYEEQKNTPESKNSSKTNAAKDTKNSNIDQQIEATKKTVEEKSNQFEKDYQRVKEEIESQQKLIKSMIP